MRPIRGHPLLLFFSLLPGRGCVFWEIFYSPTLKHGAKRHFMGLRGALHRFVFFLFLAALLPFPSFAGCPDLILRTFAP